MSEDIDVILDWRLLGYGLYEPWEERSSKKQRSFIDDMRTRVSKFLSATVLPEMKYDFEQIGLIGFSLSIAESDPQTIRFNYPQAFSDDALLQEIRLEVGALSAWSPSELLSISSYASQEFSQAFDSHQTTVRSVTPIRTFWEKVTILHREAFRDTGAVPNRYSRHYYDIYELYSSKIKDQALEDIDLLEKVVEFKKSFFRSAFAHYELAKPGTIKLIPSDESLTLLEKDYAAMRSMIFGECPDFDAIINSLKKLEAEINSIIL